MKQVDKIIKVLQACKEQGYAAKESRIKKYDNGAHEIVIEADDMMYEDYWYGFNPFAGQECVAEKGKVIWTSQYRGWMENGYEEQASETFQFLKKALRQSDSRNPIRGPREYKENPFMYANTWGKNIDNFKGEEKIWKNSAHIYTCRYFGGIVDVKVGIK